MSLLTSDLLAFKVVSLCAPVIIGSGMTLIAEVFRPGPSMPVETLPDQFFVGLFTVSAPLALIGLFCVPIAVVLLAAYVWKHRVCLRSLVVLGVVLLALVASVRTFNDFSRAAETYGTSLSGGLDGEA